MRAHVAAREVVLHLIIGSEMRLTLQDDAKAMEKRIAGAAEAASPQPHTRRVLFVQTRRGYGNLSHWITASRRRASKGAHLAHPGEIEGKVPNVPKLAELPECLALLVPDASQSFETVFAHAMGLNSWFQDRAAIAVSLLHRPGDEALVKLTRRATESAGLPIVATGDVLMHLHSGKPLQDVLSATRLKLPVAKCGLRLGSNAEHYLRGRARLANLYERAWLENSPTLAGRCSVSLTKLKYEDPREVVPEGTTPIGHLRDMACERLIRRYPGKDVTLWMPTIEKEYGSRSRSS